MTPGTPIAVSPDMLDANRSALLETIDRMLARVAEWPAHTPALTGGTCAGHGKACKGGALRADAPGFAEALAAALVEEETRRQADAAYARERTAIERAAIRAELIRQAAEGDTFAIRALAFHAT